MTATLGRDTLDEQGVKMTSPFTRIADYAFLSDCHTGALVAPDGSVDWLCVPAVDSPSIFGSLLDREGGSFRFGPYGIVHPVSRAYVPGTNVLETTWRTRTGWLLVRDALTMGPYREAACVTEHTRPPADADAEHMLVRTVECLSGTVELELTCEPAFDYGRTPATWTVIDGDKHTADASGAGQTVRLHTDLAGRRRGQPTAGTACVVGRRSCVLRAVLGRPTRCAAERRRGVPPDGREPSRSGVTGSPTPGCPIIGGARHCNARH